MCSNAPFKGTSQNFNNFWLHLVYFVHLLIFFELVDPEIEKNYKWTLNRLKVGMISSFHPHIIRKQVERVTAKTGCTSCTKWTISFEVSRFHTRTHLLQRGFIFFTYFESILFVRSTCTIQSHIINFEPFLTSFGIFLHLLIFWAKWHWYWKAL